MRYLVGILKSGKESVGCFVLDVDIEQGESKICECGITEDTFLGPVENAEFRDGVLVGTQGRLERYSIIDILPNGYRCRNSRVVILGTDSFGYYYVCRNPLSKCLVERVTGYDLKRDLQIGRCEYIANARVIKGVNLHKSKIAPISGKFNKWYSQYDGIEYRDKIVLDEKSGRQWRVRVKYPGEVYGRGYCVDIDKYIKCATVYFYSLNSHRDSFPEGQFVSSYYKETIEGHTGGLSLNMEVKEWFIGSECMKEIKKWLVG